jgi:hypothetical protein
VVDGVARAIFFSSQLFMRISDKLIVDWLFIQKNIELLQTHVSYVLIIGSVNTEKEEMC